jgi:hypothetical protein
MDHCLLLAPDEVTSKYLMKTTIKDTGCIIIEENIPVREIEPDFP